MHNEAYQHTKYFAEEVGERVAGKEAIFKASDYILDFRRKNGMQTEVQEYDVPVCDIVKSEVSVKAGGEWIDLRNTPGLFSRPTPEGGITLPIVFVEDGSIAVLEQRDVKGKAVLLTRDSLRIYPDLDMYKRLKEYGVAAVIYTTNDGQWDVPYVYANFEYLEEDYTIPTAIIHYRTALEILNKGIEEIHMDIQFDFSWQKTRNTFGIVEGETEETVIVCGHLDSTVGSVGAADDAAGVSTAMVMAKYINEMAKAGRKPKRTLRLCAWSGHEFGLYGSKQFLLGMPEVRKKIKFVMNFDVVGHTLNNYALYGSCCDEVYSEVTRIVDELKYDWPVGNGPVLADNLNFSADQIPHMVLVSGFSGGNHSACDTMELISPGAFEQPIRFAKAMLEWALNTDSIKQGYPENVNRGVRQRCDMYGWGL